jgi:glutathione synthase/RimK-type ligase-like ATP-grasp enzyme
MRALPAHPSEMSGRRVLVQTENALKVALATCAEVPDGDDEAPALIAALARGGIDAASAVWDDPAVDWAGFDLVVVRSTWDYPARRDRFLAWAESLPFVLNPPEVLRWNTDKRYLEALGDDAVQSSFLEPGARFEAPSSPFVVKPAVGAGSIGAARYEGGDRRAEAHVADLHAAAKTVLLQPYVEGVDRYGETALIYLDGTFSHAVHKGPLLVSGAEPADGLYLEETLKEAEATPEELEVGERALEAVPFPREDLLYARVDLLPGPLVIEIELTEPSLFIGYAEGAADRFADAIAAASQRRRMRAEQGPTTSQ